MQRCVLGESFSAEHTRVHSRVVKHQGAKAAVHALAQVVLAVTVAFTLALHRAGQREGASTEETARLADHVQRWKAIGGEEALESITHAARHLGEAQLVLVVVARETAANVQNATALRQQLHFVGRIEDAACQAHRVRVRVAVPVATAHVEAHSGHANVEALAGGEERRRLLDEAAVLVAQRAASTSDVGGVQTQQHLRMRVQLGEFLQLGLAVGGGEMHTSVTSEQHVRRMLERVGEQNRGHVGSAAQRQVELVLTGAIKADTVGGKERHNHWRGVRLHRIVRMYIGQVRAPETQLVNHATQIGHQKRRQSGYERATRRAGGQLSGVDFDTLARGRLRQLRLVIGEHQIEKVGGITHTSDLQCGIGCLLALGAVHLVHGGRSGRQRRARNQAHSVLGDQGGGHQNRLIALGEQHLIVATRAFQIGQLIRDEHRFKGVVHLGHRDRNRREGHFVRKERGGESSLRELQ
mmetsp:Transcript_42642/g.107621  ORF Transcript_42642/g.107621 Transcript_42642/m.107621 type:complete len:468 (+) Transcript_42642:220-1623(+)